MSVDLRINGALVTNASGYSVTEDATPVDPSDTTGGVGQFTVAMEEDANSKTLTDKTVQLIDGSQGSTTGTARNPSSINGALSLTVDSRMAALAVQRTAQPYVGTLEGAFRYYLGLVGITSDIVIDATIAARSVAVPGWTGNVWDQMKMLCVAERVETSLVSDNIILRPFRGRVAENYRDGSRQWTIDSSQMARSVEINYYQNEHKVNSLAYPPGGWNEDVQVYTLNAGETQEFDLPIKASLSSVQQPTCVSSVDRYHVSSSVYSVTGSGEGSDLPVPPAQWIAGGGSVKVAIGEDTRSLLVTITASSETRYAPYRIAMTAGPSDNYSSLRIVGTGVFSDQQTLILNANVNPDKVTQEVGATIDNPNISTLEQAYDLGPHVLRRFGVPRHAITVTTSGINRIGETGNYRYPKIAEFNAAYVGKKIADLTAEYSGRNIAAFNSFWKSTVADLFENQAFGNVAGARVPSDDAQFRIRTATIAPGSVTYTAESDTIVKDLTEGWVGAKIADFTAQWAGKTIADFRVRPLKKATA